MTYWIRHWRHFALIYSGRAGLEAPPVKNIRGLVLDEIDHAILRHLAADGRMANLALASAVGSPPQPVLGGSGLCVRAASFAADR